MSRGLRLILCLATNALVLLTARGQDVTVEWGGFRTGSDSVVVFNASVPGARAAAVTAWLVDVPVRQVPAVRFADFFRALGLTTQTAVERFGPEARGDAAASDPAAWDVVRDRWSRDTTLQIGDRTIRFRPLPEVLRRVYADDRFPASSATVFPHLKRGVLVVLGNSENRQVGPNRVELGTVRYGQGKTILVDVANMGRAPVHVYLPLRPWRGGDFRNFEFTLEPGQRRSQLFTFYPTWLSLIKQRHEVAVRYTSGGQNGVAFVVAARIPGMRTVVQSILAILGVLLGLGGLFLGVRLVRSVLVRRRRDRPRKEVSEPEIFRPLVAAEDRVPATQPAVPPVPARPVKRVRGRRSLSWPRRVGLRVRNGRLDARAYRSAVRSARRVFGAGVVPEATVLKRVRPVLRSLAVHLRQEVDRSPVIKLETVRLLWMIEHIDPPPAWVRWGLRLRFRKGVLIPLHVQDETAGLADVLEEAEQWLVGVLRQESETKPVEEGGAVQDAEETAVTENPWPGDVRVVEEPETGASSGR